MALMSQWLSARRYRARRWSQVILHRSTTAKEVVVLCVRLRHLTDAMYYVGNRCFAILRVYPDSSSIILMVCTRRYGSVSYRSVCGWVLARVWKRSLTIGCWHGDYLSVPHRPLASDITTLAKPEASRGAVMVSLHRLALSHQIEPMTSDESPSHLQWSCTESWRK